MKIFFIPGAYDGCYYYRGYLPGVYSDSDVIAEFRQGQLDGKKLFRLAMDADVCVFQRPNTADRLQVAKLLKAKGKKIIFENDDTYLPDKGVPLSMLSSDRAREIAKQMNANLYDTLRIADGGIASTEILGDEFRIINPNVAVLKNCIDPLDEQPRLKNDTGKFRIGFVGSVASNDDYVHIADQIRALAERGDIEIVVFGLPTVNPSGAYKDDVRFWMHLPNIEAHNFVPITHYYHKLASLKLDLAIIPRKDSYFNRCKSNLKFLEMSLLRIPVLAQGFATKDGPYDQETDYMSVIYDDKWYDKVIEIKDNHEKYQAIADKAHDYVLKNYNIKTYAKEWKKTITKLCK